MTQESTKKSYKHLWLLMGWVVYFIFYALTENLIPESRCHVVHCHVDDLIPFNEYFVLFYISWYLLIFFSLLYFEITDVESFKKLSIFIIVTQVVAMIIYICWPSVQYLRPTSFEHENFCTWILSIIYAFDTPTGVCPSLHVAYSIGIASTWLKKKDAKPWVKTFIVLLVIAICFAVMFVKQHSFVDVLVAIPVSIFAEAFTFGGSYYGDRRDGKIIRQIDSMHYIMPLMYPNRCDNEAYITMDVDLEKTEAYIKAKNEGRPVEDRYSLFGLVITAAMMTVKNRPQMNRFIVNKNVYQRNEVTAAFTVKKELSDDGDETLARLELHDGDNLEAVQMQLNEQIRTCKVQDDQSTESMNFIQKLPFKHAIGAIARWADRHGWMPQSVIATDPYQCSIVLSNLGSIGMGIGYHHLMNWGTTSIFIIVGQKKNVPVYDANGNVTMKRIMKLSFTIDERIADGYYYGKSLRYLKKLLENPELMEETCHNI